MLALSAISRMHHFALATASGTPAYAQRADQAESLEALAESEATIAALVLESEKTSRRNSELVAQLVSSRAEAMTCRAATSKAEAAAAAQLSKVATLEGIVTTAHGERDAARASSRALKESLEVKTRNLELFLEAIEARQEGLCGSGGDDSDAASTTSTIETSVSMMQCTPASARTRAPLATRTPNAENVRGPARGKTGNKPGKKYRAKKGKQLRPRAGPSDAASARC